MFIFNEDRAMINKFKNLVVTDINAPDTGQPVNTTWLDPDVELKNLTYPSIIISNTGITFDPERAAAGWFQLPYAPEGFSDWPTNTDVTTSPYFAFTPIPYNISYQIDVLARNNKHATFLSAILSGPDYLHARYGYLDVPEDKTVRRMDLTSGPDRQSFKDQDGKRLFHSAYTVRVSTELLPKEVESYVPIATVVKNVYLQSLPI